jgi:SAM-dependent methyltransferase
MGHSPVGVPRVIAFCVRSIGGETGVTTEGTYGSGLSTGWSEEERRLAGSEDLFDTATFRHLETIGIAEGMRCLEVGGGTGSVGRFMAERVGSSGHVLVTDLDVRLVRGCDGPNIEVRVHDISSDPLEASAYDVIHARMVLEHLPSRLDVLHELFAALRPGGRLLVEDVDCHDLFSVPQFVFLEPEHLAAWLQAMSPVFVKALGATDFDGDFGRELPRHLAAAGFDDVDADYRIPFIRGGTPAADYVALSLVQLAPAFIASGMSEDDIGTFTQALGEPDTMLTWLTMVSAWARRPA